MCGTGPLIFEKWEKGDSVTLKRNPIIGATRIIMIVLSIALSRIRTPDCNWCCRTNWTGPRSPEVDQFLHSADNANVKAGKVVLDKYTYPAYRYVGYNEARDLFKDKRVRWALSHAIPVDQIIDKIYHGLAERLTGPFARQLGLGRSLEPVTYDLGKARQLLDEAGWTDTNGDGVRDKEIDGKRVDAKFDMIIYADRPQYLSIAEIMQENCRQIGVDVQISPTKWALMLQKLRKKEFDACILGWATGWKDDPFQIWHGSQADAPDSSNAIGYKNPESTG